jgi:hypothetical protein
MLLVFEVLIIHLIDCGCEVEVVLELASEWHGRVDDPFVHDEPPKIGYEKSSGCDRRSFKVKRRCAYGVKSWLRPRKPASGFALLTALMFSSLTMFNTSLSAQAGRRWFSVRTMVKERNR